MVGAKVNQADHRFLRRPPLADASNLTVSQAALEQYICSKYGEPSAMDVSPSLRYRLRYASADDCYEALVSSLVKSETSWLDVGCGRDIFPSNYSGARKLADEAGFLVGVDPDNNIIENDLLDERFQGVVEKYHTDRRFNLVTLRMVAEHVVDADRCVAKLAELTISGGLVIIYTPWKWAPMSVAASLIPFAWHNRLKRLIWDTEEQDTFPTAYKMNTRQDLSSLFCRHGFQEVLFERLDDCSIFTRYGGLNRIEIGLRNLMCRVGVIYPEYCLLGAYRKR